MRKQALVIGLGRFGMSVARTLSERGVEVLVADRREDTVHEASRFVTEAIVFNATEEAALARLAPERRDFCICAIGNDSRESAIIVTALLRQMGAKKLIARANDPVLARILKLVGAHEVVDPEREFGERFANKLIHEGLLGELPLGKDLSVSEIRPPLRIVGKSLFDLALPKRFGINVVAVRAVNSSQVTMPDAKRPIDADDILIVVSQPDKIVEFIRESDE